jgi:hypothetical protein
MSKTPTIPPFKLSQPALRALHGVGITTAEDFRRFTEDEIKNLHGIDNNALVNIVDELTRLNIPFK